MIKKSHARLALTMLFFLSSSQASSNTINISATSAIRILGIVAATTGLVSIPRKNCSTFWSTALLIAGTTAALGADKIIKEPTFWNRLSAWGTQLSDMGKSGIEAISGKIG